MQPLIQQFVNSFQKAVRAEMDAMREQMGPYEVPVSTLCEEAAPTDSQHRFYNVTVATPSDKLVLHGECTLAYDGGESLVTITALNRDRLTLRCADTIPSGCTSWTLVIYPWFLYERLLLALEALPTSVTFQADSALTLFGKITPLRNQTPAEIVPSNLNSSQQRAVQLCCDTNVAFIWGPPGTGKTRTISQVVAELLAQGNRVLLTSTTNAAIDQALAVLVAHPKLQPHLADGLIVRVGATSAETYGTALNEVLRHQNAAAQEKLAGLEQKASRLSDQVQACRNALQKLKSATSGHQLDMFRQAPDESLHAGDLMVIFSRRLADQVLALMPSRKQAALDRRCRRLEQAGELCRIRIRECLDRLSGKEIVAIRKARVVLATMTNMYISRLLSAEQFDVVIVEEAGMAVLPTLFYCAGMAARKVIAVGDPRQLPPIVQSKDPFVQRAMGRSIFEVTVPNPEKSPIVAMLDTQYRMHPIIGTLVSELFYSGRLRNAGSAIQRDVIAAKRPFPMKPLVVLDTQGTTQCARSDGSYSRYNRQTAELCVQLASEAVADGIASIAIITPYAQQSRLISSLLAEASFPDGVVECRTVHRFQGNERDLVILDTVDTLPGKPGILLAGRQATSSAPHLLNVSLSRAKGKLVIVADVAYFHNHAAGSMIDQVLTSAMQTGIRVMLPAPACAAAVRPSPHT